MARRRSTPARKGAVAYEDDASSEEFLSQSFEALLSFAAMLRRSDDLAGLLDNCISELVHRNGFAAGALVAADPTWPALCSAALPDTPKAVLHELLARAAERRRALETQEAGPYAEFHPNLHIIEDPAGKRFGPGMSGAIQIPIQSATRVLAEIHLVFRDRKITTPVRLRLIGAAVQLMEVVLQSRSPGVADTNAAPASTHGQQLETLGRLAAGVAHDFNNLLQGMMGYTSLLGMQLGDRNPRVLNYLEGLEKEVLRGGSLCDQLLALSRGGSAVTEIVDMNDLIHETAQLLERTLDRRIEISTSTPAAPLMLMAVKNELAQAVTTLCLNARDLMPAGGSIRIAASTVPSSQLPFPTGFGPAFPTSMCVEVTHSGVRFGAPGPSGYRDLTGPLASGGSRGETTMAPVEALARRHQGFVTIFTAIGEGRSVKLYLPLTDHNAR